MSAPARSATELMSVLKQQRDELKLKAHLFGKELQDEWDTLEEKYRQMRVDYEKPLQDAVVETGDEVWKSLKQVGEEIRSGFERIRRAI